MYELSYTNIRYEFLYLKIKFIYTYACALNKIKEVLQIHCNLITHVIDSI